MHQEPIRPPCEWIVLIKKSRPSEWPRHPRSSCYQCSLCFDHVPCLIPINWRSSDNSVYLYGSYCSWNCAKQYARRRIPNYKWGLVLSLLALQTTLMQPPVCIREDRRDIKIQSYDDIRVTMDIYVCEDQDELELIEEDDEPIFFSIMDDVQDITSY
jgi:hypothetical protein